MDYKNSNSFESTQSYFKLRSFLWHLKQRLPYVRRREYAVMAQRYEQALLAFMAKPSMATDAAFTVMHQRAETGTTTGVGRDLCLFVSYAPQPRVKAHVLHHIQAFRQEGFAVILILNSPHAAETFTFDPALVTACEAICVRENTGLDFAAWAHAVDHFKLGAVADLDRVVLANDSIIGPVSQPAFKALVDRVRASSSDVIGLTENWSPRWHLQSFFLVFQHAALRRGLFAQAMALIQNLPTKDLVIDVYETHFTLAMKAQGLRCEALFESDPNNLYKANSIYYRWASLMARGFPYLKVSVLAEGQHNPAVRAALPADLLQAWEQEQHIGPIKPPQ